MDYGDENACPALGDEEQPHPEPALPDAQGSSTESSPNGYMLDYYRAQRQFRFGRFLAPTRFPAPDDDVWMRFIDDETVADGVYRNGRFGAILALELEEPAVAEFDRLLRMRRQAQSHRFSAPTLFPPEHGAAYTTLAMIHETMMGWLDSVPDGGAAAYRNGGFGGVPAAEEAVAALPETTVGEAVEGECAVCLEGYKAGDTLRTMPCSHGFHERCIFQWLRVSCLCPLCRFALLLVAADETEPFSFMGEEDDHYGGDAEEEPSAWIHQMHSS